LPNLLIVRTDSADRKRERFAPVAAACPSREFPPNENADTGADRSPGAGPWRIRERRPILGPSYRTKNLETPTPITSSSTTDRPTVSAAARNHLQSGHCPGSFCSGSGASSPATGEQPRASQRDGWCDIR
jgi:hypothetical protein